MSGIEWCVVRLSSAPVKTGKPPPPPPRRIVTLAGHSALEQVPVKGSGSLLGSLEASERPKESVAHGRGRNLKDVGDQALMRGLATAFPGIRPGLFLSYGGRRRVEPATKRLSAFPCRGSIPTHARRLGGSPRVRSCWPHLVGNRPHEADQLPSDGRAHDRRPLASPGQSAIASGQPRLCLPGDLTDLGRQLLEDVELFAHPAVVDADRSRRSRPACDGPVDCRSS